MIIVWSLIIRRVKIKKSAGLVVGFQKFLPGQMLINHTGKAQVHLGQFLIDAQQIGSGDNSLGRPIVLSSGDILLNYQPDPHSVITCRFQAALG